MHRAITVAEYLEFMQANGLTMRDLGLYGYVADGILLSDGDVLGASDMLPVLLYAVHPSTPLLVKPGTKASDIRFTDTQFFAVEEDRDAVTCSKVVAVSDAYVRPLEVINTATTMSLADFLEYWFPRYSHHLLAAAYSRKNRVFNPAILEASKSLEPNLWVKPADDPYMEVTSWPPAFMPTDDCFPDFFAKPSMFFPLNGEEMDALRSVVNGLTILRPASVDGWSDTLAEDVFPFFGLPRQELNLAFYVSLAMRLFCGMAGGHYPRNLDTDPGFVEAMMPYYVDPAFSFEHDFLGLYRDLSEVRAGDSDLYSEDFTECARKLRAAIDWVMARWYPGLLNWARGLGSRSDEKPPFGPEARKPRIITPSFVSRDGILVLDEFEKGLPSAAKASDDELDKAIEDVLKEHNKARPDKPPATSIFDILDNMPKLGRRTVLIPKASQEMISAFLRFQPRADGAVESIEQVVSRELLDKRTPLHRAKLGVVALTYVEKVNPDAWPELQADGFSISSLHIWLVMRWAIGACYDPQTRRAFWTWQMLDHEAIRGFKAALKLLYVEFMKVKPESLHSGYALEFLAAIRGGIQNAQTVIPYVLAQAEVDYIHGAEDPAYSFKMGKYVGAGAIAVSPSSVSPVRSEASKKGIVVFHKIVTTSPTTQTRSGDPAFVRKYAELEGARIPLHGSTDVEEIGRKFIEECPHLAPIWPGLANDIWMTDAPTLRPRIFVSSPGCGKSHAASTLAKVIGVTYKKIDASAAFGGMIAGTDRGYDNSKPCEPAIVIAENKSANPLMFVDEVDKAVTGREGSIANSLLNMIELNASGLYQDQCLLGEVDISRVSWILAVNAVGSLPTALLDRCTVVHIPSPTDDQILAIARNMQKSVYVSSTFTDEQKASFMYEARDLDTLLRAWKSEGGGSLRALKKYIVESRPEHIQARLKAVASGWTPGSDIPASMSAVGASNVLTFASRKDRPAPMM